ncbi:DUF1049 domain-containing protein [Pseudomonas sp. D1-1]|uniref:DUF1049 domain-containing protein n=1 Tax=Pseudomonas sp. D1-1 TaxID=1040793 RepID=UPI003DA7F420
MRNMMRTLLALFALLLVLATLTFVLENQEPTSLLFLGWKAPELPISMLMVFALLLGMSIGPLIGWNLGRRFRASRNKGG